MTDAATASRAGEIVHLIRAVSHSSGEDAISHDEAVALIERFAGVHASQASIKATSEAFEKAMAVFDGAMSKPLVMVGAVK